jgi:hypothetical protein
VAVIAHHFKLPIVLAKCHYPTQASDMISEKSPKRKKDLLLRRCASLPYVAIWVAAWSDRGMVQTSFVHATMSWPG